MARLCHLRDAIVRSRKCDLLDELPSDSGVETRGMGAVRFGCLGAGREGGGEIAEMDSIGGGSARTRTIGALTSTGMVRAILESAVVSMPKYFDLSNDSSKYSGLEANGVSTSKSKSSSSRSR